MKITKWNKYLKSISFRVITLLVAVMAIALFPFGNIYATALLTTNSVNTESRENLNEASLPVAKTIKISGKVFDDKGEALVSVVVAVDGTTTATMTDIDGSYTINAPADAKLKFTYIGFEPQTVEIKGRTTIDIMLIEKKIVLDEVVVVGYGQQKRESVVGAIAQTKGDEIMRAGVVSNVGQALSGLLPGLSTSVLTGMPGAEDPKITIRGLSSWNGSNPLVLIDGVSRNMSDIDVGQIESISVLKDASATAVFGVKGGEGVILITTKRGKEGKAQISFSSNTTFKFAADIASKMDAYDTFSYQNEVLEKQAAYNSSNWAWYVPQAELRKYRYPATQEEANLYPNINWQDEVLKSYAITQRYDLNITGGTNFAKYFAALSYLKDEDLLNSGLDVGLPYKPKWQFEHYNFRSNIDLNLTKTTVLSTNLAGSIRKKQGFNYGLSHLWNSLYSLSPSAFPVRYEDGTFGYDANKPNTLNPMAILSGASGITSDYTTQLMADFTLKQDMDFITRGLSAQATISYDNRLYSGSSISQITLLGKSISKDGTIAYSPSTGTNDYDYVNTPGWLGAESFWTSSTGRRLYYKGQLNYTRSFGVHDITALALMSREENATGSEFPHYHEDWVGRLTYAYDKKYFIEGNAAYNGSENFSAKYRFGFFPSVGIGWMASNEPFLKKLKWLEKLKFRYSIGKVGSDNFTSDSSIRWAYMTGWSAEDGGKIAFGDTYTSGDVRTSPGATYLQYREAVVGNPDLHWEVSKKQNAGVELALFKNIFVGSFEVFRDDRTDVFMSKDQRSAMPGYFGAAPVAANLGEVQNKGYELDVKLQYTWSDLHLWTRYTYAHAKDKVIYREDPELRPDYLKVAGFQIGQPRNWVEQPGFTTSWDDLYGSVQYETNAGRLPGEIVMIDYNADGVIDSKDQIPFGYPNRPQNTYNIFFGVDYKGFSIQVQFLGVNNVSQYYDLIIFSSDERAPYANSAVGNYWTPSNPSAEYPLYRFGGSGYTNPVNRGRYLDGSYIRLKNVELSYTMKNDYLKKMRISAMKFILSGNNLLYWSDMPEDREETFSMWSATNLYPTIKRINLGVNVTF